MSLTRDIGEKEKEKTILPNQIEQKSEECLIIPEHRIVRGNSLVPLIENGQTVKILFGYYKCNEIKRGDIVAYDYTGDKNPIIKIAKGIPGDSFKLKETENGWNILINNEILKNSENNPYLITGNKYKMLSLYEDNCQNGIPEKTYLLLGNLISGSVDSTQFGLIDKSGILGKVDY